MAKERIRNILAKRGITISELADSFKVSQAQVVEWIGSNLSQERRAQILNAIDIISLKSKTGRRV